MTANAGRSGCCRPVTVIQKNIVIDEQGEAREIIIPWAQFCELGEALGLDFDAGAQAELRASLDDSRVRGRKAFTALDGVRRGVARLLRLGNSMDTVARMSTLTLQLDDRLAREIARAAEANHLPPDEWAKAQLATAAGAQSPSAPARVLGLHAGEPYAMSADFDAPLDDFKGYL